MSVGGKGSPMLATLNKIDSREQVAKDLDMGSEVENVPPL